MFEKNNVRKYHNLAKCEQRLYRDRRDVSLKEKDVARVGHLELVLR